MNLYLRRARRRVILRSNLLSERVGEKGEVSKKTIISKLAFIISFHLLLIILLPKKLLDPFNDISNTLVFLS